MKATIYLIKIVLSKFNLVANLTAKNLALHQQLIDLNHSIKKTHVKIKDRLYWILLCLLWNSWQESLIIQKPETAVDWHKKAPTSLVYSSQMFCLIYINTFLF